jgi:hypothetical protein
MTKEKIIEKAHAYHKTWMNEHQSPFKWTQEAIWHFIADFVLSLQGQSTPAPYPSDEEILQKSITESEKCAEPPFDENTEFFINGFVRGFVVGAEWLRDHYFPNQREEPISDFTNQEIRDKMDADMEDGGMSQGEIESCLSHWNNKYLITKRDSTPQRQDG